MVFIPRARRWRAGARRSKVFHRKGPLAIAVAHSSRILGGRAITRRGDAFVEGEALGFDGDVFGRQGGTRFSSDFHFGEGYRLLALEASTAS
jgi:hypothetical protein